ncbi:MAG: hypothetical protein AAF629_24900 [Chloroflexota bacterium]
MTGLLDKQNVIDYSSEAMGFLLGIGQRAAKYSAKLDMSLQELQDQVGIWADATGHIR